ncbi:MAG: ATP:cob(I)alamin adenosyltransferase [Candidatus Micrarchaeota archaeon]|nr:ATP:cob(I)alamin adenosyltransferase [Candidatus Micrarchaeota archaeon]MCX8154219.1 ATP:cob(I)alamin adenosyltransferase [Candidatus Micrarchaeota archaeon]
MITTRQGDSGFTSIMNRRVRKTDPTIKLIGKIDELISILGYIKTKMKGDELDELQEHLKKLLNELSYERDIERSMIEDLDRKIDNLERSITIQLNRFVKPKGESAILHYLRALVRETEIYAWETNFVNISIYMNRLSDYIFLLALDESIKRGEFEYFRS